MSTAIAVAPAYGVTLSSAHLSDENSLAFFEGIEDVYTFHIRDFTGWCREREFGVNIDSVREYFDYLKTATYTPSHKDGEEAPQAKRYSANTRRIKIQAVRRRIRQMMENAPLDDQLRLEQLLKGLTAPKVADPSIHRDKYLTPTEVDRLLEGARTERQYYWIKFLVGTGCRIAEASGIRLSDVEIVGKRVNLLVVGKGDKSRTVMITLGLYEDIRRVFHGAEWLFETQGGKEYRGCYVSGQIKKLGQQILGRKISAHSMRHSFATNVLKRGVQIEALSRYLGHSTVSITLNLYCHEQITEEDIFDFIEEMA